MRYKHIVWDWNGTLLNDLWLCIESINFVLESRGMSQVDKESYKSIFTFPVIKYYEHLGFDFSKEKFPIPGFLNYYRNYFKKCNLHQHVHEVLKKNRDKRLTQSILSAGKQDSLIDWVAHHKIDHYFNAIVGIQNDAADGKTDAGLNWLSKVDTPKKEILLIGDTIHDSDVAEQMGVHCVLVDIGHVSRERLLKTGRNVFESLDSLNKYING